MDIPEIIHDAKSHKFYCLIEGKECYVQYRIVGDVMDIFFTFTPPGLRGRGIAKEILDELEKYAVKNNLTIKASCSFASYYFKL